MSSLRSTKPNDSKRYPIGPLCSKQLRAAWGFTQFTMRVVCRLLMRSKHPPFEGVCSYSDPPGNFGFSDAVRTISLQTRQATSNLSLKTRPNRAIGSCPGLRVTLSQPKRALDQPPTTTYGISHERTSLGVALGVLVCGLLQVGAVRGSSRSQFVGHCYPAKGGPLHIIFT